MYFGATSMSVTCDRQQVIYAMDSLVKFLKDKESLRTWKLGVTCDIRDKGRLEEVACSNELFETSVSIFKDLIKFDLHPVKLDNISKKVNVLESMNCIINHLVDEDIVSRWLQEGIPDNSDSEDLRELAIDEEIFSSIVELFIKYAKDGGNLYIGDRVY